MSGFLAGKVWQSALDSNLKPLAACLADLGNHEGSGIHPSVEYLTWLLGVSERTVRKGMVELRNIGALVTTENEAGGRGKIPHYFLDVDRLPERKSWREIKGAKNNTLSTKGAENDIQRVQLSTQKGAENGIPYKEEPLVEPLVLTSHPSAGKPSSKKQLTKNQQIYEFIKTGYERKKLPLTWGPAEWKQLAALIKERPDMADTNLLRACLNNRFKSENINPGERPCQWLRKLPNYQFGPLNEFGKMLKSEVNYAGDTTHYA